jgi:DNA-binding SARP family transcriptional activator/DNA-binding PadR family transcriptional regulator
VTGRLEVKFLGPPDIFFGGQPVKFATRKALALLAYLVVEPGTHPREKLQAIFWPESETRLAQSALRNTLARIKGGLRDVDEPLRIEGDRVGFNYSSAYSLDLDLVTRATTDTLSTQIATSTLPLLQDALEGVRGPFLEAFSLPDTPEFDNWIIFQRTAWDARLNLIYDRLSNHQLKSHLIQQAIETVNRWLDLDRWNEIAYRRLMRLHFMNGDRSAALQTYEACRSLLAEELGVEPSPNTADVLAHIRATPLPTSIPPDKAHSPQRIPFVGCSSEYQALTEATYYIMLCLVEPLHGDGVMQKVKEISGGTVNVGPDILYGVFSTLEKEGLIVKVREEGRCKCYALTPKGQRILIEQIKRLEIMTANGSSVRKRLFNALNRRI